MQRLYNRTYAETLDIGGNHTGLPLQVVLIFIICVSPVQVWWSEIKTGVMNPDLISEFRISPRLKLAESSPYSLPSRTPIPTSEF